MKHYYGLIICCIVGFIFINQTVTAGDPLELTNKITELSNSIQTCLNDFVKLKSSEKLIEAENLNNQLKEKMFKEYTEAEKRYQFAKQIDMNTNMMKKDPGNPFAKDLTYFPILINLITEIRVCTCQFENIIARGYLTLKLYNEAKRVYRQVVVNYDKDTPCVKEAEFGLQDIRDMKAAK